MSGVVAAMRRTLLSCTSLARHGLLALATTLSVASEPALAGDLSLSQVVTVWFDLNHQEFAVLTTALALVGFSVVAAILLMRTRVKATRTETRLRQDIADLQVQADRLRALLFAEPQILISWAAGDNRPQISGDTALLISQDAQHHSPQRILAFGTWLPPEPALQMDHAVDALREAGEGFLLNLSTSNGRAIEAMGRAIGGQAIVRIRELGGLRRELAEANLRYKTLQEETELLRDFAAAAPWPIWAKSAEGNLRYANKAYVRATEATSVADAIHRNLELLETDQRADMGRVLNDNASFSARLPIVVGGERRIYDIQSLKLGGGSAGIAIDASEATTLRAALERMAEAHRRTLDQLSSGVAVFDAQRRLAFYNESYQRLWGLDQTFLDGQPDDSSVLDRLRAARKLPEQPAFRAWKDQLREQPHIETVESWCRPLFDDALTWRTLREAITAIGNRAQVALKLERKDGSVLTCMTMPLPDGATMLTFQDITDTENVERALRERNEALEAADQMKVDFVHHVSYELRAPLTTIIGFAHFLSDPSTGPLT